MDNGTFLNLSHQSLAAQQVIWICHCSTPTPLYPFCKPVVAFSIWNEGCITKVQRRVPCTSLDLVRIHDELMTWRFPIVVAVHCLEIAFI